MRWSTRRATAAALAAVAAALGLAATAAPAAAHGSLVMEESTPVEGARLSEPVESVRLVFTEAPVPVAHVTVTAPDGTRVDGVWSNGQPFPLDTPVQEFNLVDDTWEPVYYSTGFPVDVPVAHWPEAGDYTVDYTTVASDGDVVEGTYAFSYTGEPTAAPDGWEPRTEGPDPTLEALVAQAEAPAELGPGGSRDTGEVLAEGTAAEQPTAAVDTDAVEGASASPGTSPAVYVVVGVLVLAALASVVAVSRRGRARPAAVATGATGAPPRPPVRRPKPRPKARKKRR
ncbi:copper resistance CopC family protein [Aquipuribacter sp. SD81]|uniref:copper resistance CopC family protein n=1 Tax=Aquipuribacter sp. SD81 TaxID=3127703 RepID=UPI00301948DE